MFAKHLAQGFSGTFYLKEKLSREAFWPYVGILSALYVVLALLLNAFGPLGAAVSSIGFTVLFVSAFWRRRNDIGYPGWTAIFWIIPSALFLIGQIIGPPVHKPVPDIPAGLGDAGLFLFFTPEFGSAASASLENSLNDLWYQLLYKTVPAALTVALAIVELVLGRKSSRVEEKK